MIQNFFKVYFCFMVVVFIRMRQIAAIGASLPVADDMQRVESAVVYRFYERRTRLKSSHPIRFCMLRILRDLIIDCGIIRGYGRE